MEACNRNFHHVVALGTLHLASQIRHHRTHWHVAAVTKANITPAMKEANSACPLSPSLYPACSLVQAWEAVLEIRIRTMGQRGYAAQKRHI